MSSHTEEDLQARGAVATLVSLVLAFACLFVLAGLSGAAYLWFQEQSKSDAQSKKHATQLASLQSEIDTIHQVQQQLNANSKAKQDKLRADWQKERQSQQQVDISHFAFVPPKTFKRPERLDRPTTYPQPIPVEKWTGRLRIARDRPAEYILSTRRNTSLRPYPNSPDSIRNPFAFNQDRSKFFIIDGSYTLRRFDSTTLKEEMSLDVGQKCYDMVLTASGLALSFPGRSAVWMIDPQQMTVQGEVPLQFATHLAATPTSERVYAIGYTQAIGFDPHTRQIDRSLHFNEQGVLEGAQHFINNRIHGFVMHSDNEHFYTAYGAGMALHRFAITPTEVRYESSAAAHPRSDFSTLAMSQNGKWIMMPYSGPAYVFETNEASTARLRLTADGSITACQFDPTSGKIVAAVYTRSESLHLNLYTPTGELDRTYWLLMSDIEICRIEALPVGQRYLIWTEYGVRVIDLLNDRIKAQIPEQVD